MRATLLKCLIILGVGASLGLPSLASPIVFAATGQFQGGGSLSGTVTIDTATGAVFSADLSATVIQTFVFSSNIGGVPNYANSGLFVIVGDDSKGAYPVALVGLAETSLVGYDGGPISPASDIIFQDGGVDGIVSGNLNLLSVSPQAGHTIGTFGATGLVNGNPLSGSFQIDVTTGAVLSSTLTVTIPHTYHLNSNIGGISNYANSGLFVIVVDEAAGGYPVLLLGLNRTDLIGYTGSVLSPASDIQLNNGTIPIITLASGSLAPAPEPSTLALFGIGGGLLVVAKRRKGV